ncbi:MAG TPA: ATP-binding protein [Vicinamibacteria bacterium]|nr:ATP-binding protein [Vicinamibacteria bacterium]
MKRTPPRTVRVDIASRYDMLEMVQTVLSHVTGLLHLDEDAAHYVNVAIRESVVNAIKHGNRGDAGKRVAIEFLLHPGALEVTVQDEGSGFDPAGVPSPLTEENLLKADGRGIFFMRSFMDEVEYAFPARGGTVVRMLKRLPVVEQAKG